MGFSIKQVQGYVGDIVVELESNDGHAREARVLEVLKRALSDAASSLGGYLAVSGTGSINAHDGLPGDSINLQLNSLLPPDPPVEDAGLAPALSSPRNRPPEAVTAAPATEDKSPPATQKPLPQNQRNR